MRDRVQAVKPFKRNPNGEVTDEGRVVLSTKSMYSACPIIWTYFNDFVAKIPIAKPAIPPARANTKMEAIIPLYSALLNGIEENKRYSYCRRAIRMFLLA